jgi:hypothetical protein
VVVVVASNISGVVIVVVGNGGYVGRHGWCEALMTQTLLLNRGGIEMIDEFETVRMIVGQSGFDDDDDY